MSRDSDSSVVAIITARGGSKGLPNKNLLELAGKPLVSYSIEAGLECNQITDVFVTTDSLEIASVSLQWGAQVIDRPSSLSTDSASSYETVKHAIEYLKSSGYRYTYFVLLQPTSPLRNATHLSEALSMFFSDKQYRSCISVCETEHSPYKMFTLNNRMAKPLFDAKYLDMPRQNLNTTYRQNGAIYLMKCEDFITKTNNFFLNPVLLFVMDSKSSVDIDGIDDFNLAEYYLSSKAGNKPC